MTTRVSHDEINRRIIADIRSNILNNKDFEKLKKFQEEDKRLGCKWLGVFDGSQPCDKCNRSNDYMYYEQKEWKK